MQVEESLIRTILWWVASGFSRVIQRFQRDGVLSVFVGQGCLDFLQKIAMVVGSMPLTQVFKEPYHSSAEVL